MGRLRIWNTSGYSLMTDISIDIGAIDNYDVSPDGKYLLISSDLNCLQLWDIDDIRVIQPFC
jgi:WD40 repeat protein